MAVPSYQATAVQFVTQVVDAPEDNERVVKTNLDRALDLVDYVFEDPRYASKLLVFPEFFLTGVPESRRHEEYLARAMTIPGDVTAAFGERARRYGAYIAGNAFERDEEWPDRVFNTSWIVGPGGEVVLRYRKLNDTQTYMPTSTNPGDIYSAYVERYGIQALFPVVDTEIGRLACLTCYDINFPEVARCLALQGAEVLVMPTGEGYSFHRHHRLMKRARAYENTCYLVTANHGGFVGRRPNAQQRGYSEVIDFHGDPVACADGPGEATISGRVDLAALRDARARVGDHNFLVALRASLYAPQYAAAEHWPLDHWAGAPLRDNAEALALGQDVRESLYRSGVLVRPFTYGEASGPV